MNKVERIRQTVKGNEVDQIPYAFWTHLPGIDLDPVKLADTTYDFYKEYDIDFIKTMNNGMYAIEDYDCEIDYSDIEKGGVAKLIKTPVKDPSDWEKIDIKDPNKGSLGREIDSLSRLTKMVKKEAPVLFTVFSPITTASKLSGGLIFEHIKNGHGDKVHAALEAISITTQNLVKRAIEEGIDGIFFATQISSYDSATEEFYLEYGQKYDLQVLESASELWFNTLHCHGENIMFDILRKYPVDVFNWHAWETLPDVDEAQVLTDKCIMGGIARMDITNRNKNEIINQIYNTIKLTKKKKLILTPGCVIRYPLDKDILKFIREIKTSIEKSI